eukprot:476072-Pleurochrysis_carterae.AAC.1
MGRCGAQGNAQAKRRRVRGAEGRVRCVCAQVAATDEASARAEAVAARMRALYSKQHRTTQFASKSERDKALKAELAS